MTNFGASTFLWHEHIDVPFTRRNHRRPFTRTQPGHYDWWPVGTIRDWAQRDAVHFQMVRYMEESVLVLSTEAPKRESLWYLWLARKSFVSEWQLIEVLELHPPQRWCSSLQFAVADVSMCRLRCSMDVGVILYFYCSSQGWILITGKARQPVATRVMISIISSSQMKWHGSSIVCHQ